MGISVNRCRLCGNDRDIRLSHIIPEFMYKPLYDRKHRYQVLTDSANIPPRREQKGIRERLLCESCETKIGKYERYASLIWNNQKPVAWLREGDFIQAAGIDYTQFKLFALSVLWRAGVSSIEMFDQVKLGPHEEPLKRMLQTEDPGNPDQYPVLLARVVSEGEPQTNMILPPTWARFEDHKAYRFIFGGFAWIFIVSNHRLPRSVRHFALCDAGTMRVLTSEIDDMPFLRDLMASIHNSGNML